MRMSNPTLCCDNCFSIIAKKNARAAKLWLDLCEIQGDSGFVFGLLTTDFSKLRFLEMNRFLISHETDNVMIVHMKKKEEGNLMYFCGGACEKQQ